MRSLPEYAKVLLLEGAKVTGSFTEGFGYVEEKILTRDVEELRTFCQWIDENIGGASQYNIHTLFQTYKNPHDEKLAAWAKELAEKIRNIRSL